jgi:hypothetical protein
MEIKNKIISQIKPGMDTGRSFGAIGYGYVVVLSNKEEVESDDEDLMDRYVETREDRLSLTQLNELLVGKIWEDLN